ncbi:hypothetical protein [Undibacterium sp.]|jgi:hypothetical protein|uniref:hypothetical protein n=1 Tax=Undibacterium sp. TaxID=1914977 RepID=UPI002BCEB774|nr:hypothetical protein [Undibacterium sp.]HTD05019.1 hypothetical protein [Undibacterium sp.]
MEDAERQEKCDQKKSCRVDEEGRGIGAGQPGAMGRTARSHRPPLGDISGVLGRSRRYLMLQADTSWLQAVSQFGAFPNYPLRIKFRFQRGGAYAMEARPGIGLLFRHQFRISGDEMLKI